MENKTKSIDKDVVVRRLYARGTWKLKSVAHFGGAETGIADMCLLKDEEGKPFIPAASIAGAARSFLARQLLEWDKYSHKDGLVNEPKVLKWLFGGAGEKDTMSALFVADAECVSEEINISIRDGVRVVHESGTAADGAKFDVEVVERGTEFKFGFECVIREDDREKKYDELFLALLHAFQQGDIRLGARTRRGYGRGKVKAWEIRDLQMENPEDVMAWLAGNPWSRPKSDLEDKLVDYTPASDRRCYFHIEADFKLRTSLLIRSSSVDSEAPDMVHLESVGKPVVPGTSFAGAFRHRATLIAKTIRWSDDDVNKMFGYVKEKKSDNTQQADAQASRVWIEEKLVKDVETRWQDRVAIDRFTGGSLQSALFNEKPVYPLSLKEMDKNQNRSNIRLQLTVQEPEKAEIGLLLLTLRDFSYGHAALGGEISNGRGTLCGMKAVLKYKEANSSDVKVWELSHNNKRMAIEKGDKDFLESCVKQTNQLIGSEQTQENRQVDQNAE